MGQRERAVLRGLSLGASALARVDVRTGAPLPDGPALWCGNHRSVFDPLVAYAAFRKWQHPVSNLTHEKFMAWPGIGWLLRSVQCVPIGSERPGESVNLAVDLLRGGRSVGVMPEGGVRTADHWIDGLGPLQNGAAKILEAVDVPVVTMAIIGSDQVITPTGKVRFNRPRVQVGYEVLGHIANHDAPMETIAASLRHQLA